METDKIPQETPTAQPPLENEPIHKSLLNQKGSFLLILGAIVIILVVLGVGGYLLTMNRNSNSNQNAPQPTSNEVAKKLFNYKLVYYKDNKVYMYDLGTDTSHQLNIDPNTIKFTQWSNGILAFSDQEGQALFLLEPPYLSIKKLISDFVGDFFWKSDGSGIYTQKFFQNGKQVPYVDGRSPFPGDSLKSYFVLLDGTQKEVSNEEYQTEETQHGKSIKSLSPASYDGVYMTHSLISDSGFKVTLINTATGKEYPLPDYSYKPNISLNGTYIGYKDNSPNAGIFKLFILQDILAGKFDYPVITENHIYDWEWIDDENILYITSNVQSTNDSLSYTYNFNLLNIKDKTTKLLIPPFTTDQAYMTIHVSPDGKYFLYNLVHQSGKTADTYSAQNEFIVADIKTGKEIRKFSTDPFTSGWSTPIVSK